MESTLARTLKETVEFVAGILTVRDANPTPAAVTHAHPAAATETTAETSLTKVIVFMKIVSGWVRLRMVNAVSPLSALGAATSTATKTSAGTTAAHGILVIAVWCAESLTTKAAAIARGVDTVIGTVTTEAISEELAKSSPVTTMTILAAASARAIPIISALIKTAADVADLPIAKKRR
jgi:hypothetical protein